MLDGGGGCHALDAGLSVLEIGALVARVCCGIGVGWLVVWPAYSHFHGASYNLIQYGLSHPQIVRMENGKVVLDHYSSFRPHTLGAEGRIH